jgi:hypothetical protein
MVARIEMTHAAVLVSSTAIKGVHVIQVEQRLSPSKWVWFVLNDVISDAA